MTAERVADVVVVGGGVIGAATSLALAREGLSVVVLERDTVAGQASGAAAGMLAPIGEAGLPGANPAILDWGLASLSRFADLCSAAQELSGIDPELEVSGILRLAFSEPEARAMQDQQEALAARGVPAEWFARDEVDDHQPGLTADVLGALWSPGEAHVRSPLLTRAMVGAAAHLGATVHTGVAALGLERRGARITGVMTADGPLAAGAVVVTTGVDAATLGDWLDGGWTAPVTPVRGQICALDSPQPPLRTIVWGRGAYLVPKRDGSVVVGATEEHVGLDRRVTASGLAQLTTSAAQLVPALGDATFRHGWAGLRPGSPDGLPAIGRVPGTEGLWVAAGHFRNGVLLAPVTAEIVRDGILGKPRDPAAGIFDPGRWG